MLVLSIGLRMGMSQDQAPLLSSTGNLPLIELLTQWENDHDLVFSYDVSTVQAITRTPKFNDLPVTQALEKALEGSGLTFNRLDAQYFVLQQRRFPEPDAKVTKPDIPPKPNIIYKTKVYPTLKGQVTLEGQADSILALTAIFIKGKKLGTYTDSLGFFTLTGPFLPTDSVIISRMGYVIQGFSVAEIRKADKWQTELKVATQTLESIEISGKAIQPMQSATQELGINIDPQKITSLPGWGEPDVFQMLKLLPGVNSFGDATADLSIRGGSPDQNLILWDGIPLLHMGHFFGIFSVTNPYLIEKGELQISDFGVEYGDRIAAVLDIKSRGDSVTRFEKGFSFNPINSQGYIALPLFKQRASLLIGARSTYSNVVESDYFQQIFDQVFQNNKKIERNQTLAEEVEAFRLTPNFKFEDVNFKLTIPIRKRHKLSLSVLRALDFLSFDTGVQRGDSTSDLFEPITQDRLGIENWGYNLQFTRRGKEGRTTAYSFIRNEFKNFSLFNTSFRSREWSNRRRGTMSTASFKIDHVVPLKNGEAQIGFELRARENTVSNEYEYFEWNYPVDRYAFNRSIQTLSQVSYAKYKGYITPRLFLDAGLRTTLYLPVRRIFADPRLKFQYQLTADLTAHVSTGIYHQFVYQIEEFNEYQVGKRIWIQAINEDFPVLEALQSTAGFRYQKEAWDLRLTAYARRTNNIASRNPAIGFFDVQDISPVIIEDVGASDSRGLDLLIQRLGRKHQFWLGYSLSRTQFKFDRVSGGNAFDAPQDQRHNLKLAYMYHQNRWHLSSSFQFATGRPYTTPQLAEGTDGALFATFRGKINQERLPVFHQVNTSATYDWHRRSIAHNWLGNIGVSIFNLYGRSNIVGKSFAFVEVFDANEQLVQDIETLNRISLGFTPTLFISLNW
ncbi:MAG: TonB-dependent receptor plug domain-containing protein [Bacteroidota bacterium]